MIEIREEERCDKAAVRRLNEAAFENGPGRPLWTNFEPLVTTMYRSSPSIKAPSLGTSMFTPATLDNGGLTGMGLAPMAVLPSHQRQGIGSLLVRHGLEHLRKTACPFIIVLGHPGYYPRFGFESASYYKLSSQWDGVPDEAFMIVVFDRNRLPTSGGIARYHGEFDEAM